MGAALSIGRRGLLGRMALAPAVALPLPAIAAINPSPAPNPSPALMALIAAAHHADAVRDNHHRNVYEPRRAAADRAIAALPHTSVEISGSVWSTGDPAHVRLAERFARPSAAGDNPPAWRKLLAEYRQRQARVEQIGQRCGVIAALDEDDRLGNAALDADNAVAHHPVTCAADLRAKLAFMIERDMGDGVDWLEQMLTDAERLAGAR